MRKVSEMMPHPEQLTKTVALSLKNRRVCSDVRARAKSDKKWQNATECHAILNEILWRPCKKVPKCEFEKKVNQIMGLLHKKWVGELGVQADGRIVGMGHPERKY